MFISIVSVFETTGVNMTCIQQRPRVNNEAVGCIWDIVKTVYKSIGNENRIGEVWVLN